MLRSAQDTDNAKAKDKALLYRVASWPNLTQLLFIWSLCSPDADVWWARVLETYPLQHVLLYKYGFASAVGYGLTMFAETLRDRRLLSLRDDFAVLLFGTFLPVLVVLIDAHTLGDAATAYPPDYWLQFAH